KAARRNHVYPKGPSALGQELVDSLRDPAMLARGAGSGEPAPAPSAPAPSKPEPLPVNDRACWEVQVLVTTSESRAKDEVRRIEKTLNLAAWVRSDGAIHRVRVGGCLTADGAAELANRLHLEGYPEAFRALREP
ncbi:MAG: SPOR domain-containing protein, partial [Candidatus Eisenbacteria bacterium]